MIDFLNFYN